MRPPRFVYIAAVPLAIVVTLVGFNAQDITSVGSKPKMDISAMRSEIRTGLQKQLRTGLDDRSIRVIDVTCLEKSDREARCLAEASDSQFTHTHIPIRVDVDPKNEQMIWEVDR
jgi:hypothetical protein